MHKCVYVCTCYFCFCFFKKKIVLYSIIKSCRKAAIKGKTLAPSHCSKRANETYKNNREAGLHKNDKKAEEKKKKFAENQEKVNTALALIQPHSPDNNAIEEDDNNKDGDDSDVDDNDDAIDEDDNNNNNNKEVSAADVVDNVAEEDKNNNIAKSVTHIITFYILFNCGRKHH
jgi:hypothetical protein